MDDILKRIENASNVYSGKEDLLRDAVEEIKRLRRLTSTEATSLQISQKIALVRVINQNLHVEAYDSLNLLFVALIRKLFYQLKKEHGKDGAFQILRDEFNREELFLAGTQKGKLVKEKKHNGRVDL